MTNTDYVPERGDIVWMVLDPRVGHEQSGQRPVIVLSPKILAKHTNLAVICPITTRIKGLPYEIVLDGLKTKGAILPFHIRSVDIAARKIKFIEKAPEHILDITARAVSNIIGA